MPETLKEAVIKPILKKEGAEPVFKNFCPISHLHYQSKLIEKVICSQISDYVKKAIYMNHISQLISLYTVLSWQC